MINSRMEWLLLLSIASMAATDFVVAEPQDKWEWKYEEGQSLSFSGARGLIWRLNLSKNQPKVFFDPLGTLTGKSLTWNAPDDHAWHHGLWFSWKVINDVNYWEFDDSGKPAGVTDLQNVQVAYDDQAGATVQLEFLYHPAGDVQAVMKETVTLRIEVPRVDGSYRIDWRQRSTALVDIRLDRTPPPGQPGGVDYGGYGGLSFRGAKKLSHVIMTDSQGRSGMQTHRTKAKWLDSSGTIDGDQAGLTIFDHPANPRHPTPWFVVQNQAPQGPFWYANPALLCWESMQLKVGEVLELNYRILVHDGLADPNKLASEWEQFAGSLPDRSPP